MGAFDRGFGLGQSAYQQMLDNKDREQRRALDAERHRADMEERGLRTDGLRRAAAKENQLTGLRTEMADFQQGIDRPATNAALDADFEAANQAALGGLALPAVRGGSNAANEAALTVKKPVDVNSPEFQGGMAGLRSRYALASGDMKDFDAVTANERSRVRGSEDSAFALAIMQDPTGEAARSARAFINAKSGKLSSKVDPKTGMTTFARVNGDGYDEINVSPTDLGKIAMGYKRLERGDVSGLDLIAAVNKDLAATVREEMKLDLDLGKTNNTAAYQGGQLLNDNARTGIAAEGLRLRRQEVNQSTKNLREFVDAKGNTVLVDLSKLPAGDNGTVPLPPGLRPKTARPEVTTADIIKYATAMVEGGMADPDAPSRPITLEKAVAMARTQLNGGEYKTAADRIVEAYLSSRGGAPAETKPAAGLTAPSRQIGTIVPPRSAADLQPRAPMSDLELMQLLGR